MLSEDDQNAVYLYETDDYETRMYLYITEDVHSRIVERESRRAIKS